MRDAIELATQIAAAALFLSVTGAAIVVIWFIVGGAVMNKIIKAAAPSQTTDMLALAVEKGASVDTIERLIEMRERVDRNDARKAFDTAMATAKASLPVIVKNREVDFSSQKGRTHYKYEDFAGLAKQIDPILGPLGLSYRYRSSSDDKTVTVTCVISHRDGHFEENTLTGPLDHSGNKNPIQAIGSAVTYLQRYTLKLALGLAASADDDDAQSVSNKFAEAASAEPKPRYREPESGPQPTKRIGPTPEEVTAQQKRDAETLRTQAQSVLSAPHKLVAVPKYDDGSPNWKKFAENFWERAKACEDKEALFSLVEHNKTLLEEMKTHFPLKHKTLTGQIDELLDEAS